MRPDWRALEREFPPEAVRWVQSAVQREGSIAIIPRDLASQTNLSEADAERLLQNVGVFERKITTKCANCGENLDGIGKQPNCPKCQVDLSETEPETIVRYQLDRAMPRDVPWVLVVHGMNTRGEWQEELSWLVGRTYRHMVPVAIYKYGKIQPGVMFPVRQRALARKLVAKMKKLSAEAAAAGYDGVPDVIAHSFGTWLLAEALHADPQLRIGRLILLGSVVRPSYRWQTLIDRGQIDAILNHGATNDEWVPRAQFFIPGSGPGGKHGFAPPVTNVPAIGFRHSEYFLPHRLRGAFEDVWKPFLEHESPPAWRETWLADAWTPYWKPLRLLTWLITFGVLAGITAFVLTILALGIHALFV